MAMELGEESDRLAEASALNERGCSLMRAGRVEAAEESLRRSVELAPMLAPFWFDLGLLYKRMRRWDDSLRSNRRAAELDPADQPAWWNMGIAATAVRDWQAAREAWRGFGLEMPDGDGPIELDYGLTCVRLNPDTDGEVVWCSRIDPARAIIRNVPTPESGHRWGDYVLHDGEPKGERMSGGRSYPVFDELERWQASAIPTVRVDVLAPTLDDSHALVELFEQHDFGAEDWTRSIRPICQACSEGKPHEYHDPPPDEWKAERIFGLAAPEAEIERLASLWKEQLPGRRVGEIGQVG